MNPKEQVHRAQRPDGQAFDEIRIVTVPRYKTSGLSGDEWRISATIQFWRKGKMIHESNGLRNVETAIGFVMAEYYRAIDDAKGYYAGIEDYCDQEGCAEKATVTYRVKEEFSDRRPHEWHGPTIFPYIRKFCAKHSRRGDCGFDDADSNYELIEGSVSEPDAKDVRESARVVVKMDDPISN